MGMKMLLILWLLLECYTAFAQTNISTNSISYNFSNSTDTINNIYYSLVSTNNNVVSQASGVRSNGVVLPRYVIERLQWEQMLNQRRLAAFQAYLKSLDKQ